MNPDIQKIFDLADDSVKRFAPERLNWSWGQALFLYALAKIDEEHGADHYTGYLRRFYDHHIKKGYRLCSSDTSAPALGALYLALKTENGRYWSVVNAVKNYYETTPRVLEDMPNHLGTGVESLIYPKSVWVDSIMMYGVFTNWLAHATNDEKMRGFAKKQPAAFARYLQDDGTGFFYHSYWTKLRTHYPVKPIFWGRGNGWVMAALPLLLDYLPGEEREHMTKVFVRLAEALLPYQRQDGYFETVFNRPGKTYKESSATMLIASGWFYGYRKGMLGREYYDASVKAFHAVCEDIQIKDGLLSMPYISAPTSAIQLIPYLVYKLTPRGNDWTYGLAAAFFAALEYLRCTQESGVGDSE
ncbi:MAG: glycoside hydrolase family 88 protein [Oscillospiraceae bacterium]|nr:glycoside hydrolase family 88 protein [Oscillospiraceae bacterium]